MAITLKCESKALKSALVQLKASIGQSKSKQRTTIVEIDISKELLSLSVIGAKQNVKCQSENYGKAMVPFITLYHIVKDQSPGEVDVEISDGVLKIGQVSAEYDSIKVIHPEDQREIDLPMNYTTKGLLNLRHKFTEVELERRNLVRVVDEAENKLDENILLAFNLLAKYGVSYEELRELVYKKLSGDT